MSNESCDLLYDAAVAWKELTQYYYIFTYGYKKQLYTINLSFTSEKFPHLAGFQYLKDVSLPRFSPSKTLDMVLAGKIRHSQIEKGSQYEESVKPRLEALIRLKQTIEQVIANNPQSVEDYRNGKEKAIGFLVGQTMKAMKGKADPGTVNKILTEILDAE